MCCGADGHFHCNMVIKVPFVLWCGCHVPWCRWPLSLQTFFKKKKNMRAVVRMPWSIVRMALSMVRCIVHTARHSGVDTQKNAREMGTRASSCGCGNRRSQVRQVSKDDLMESFYNPTLKNQSAESVRSARGVGICVRPHSN